MIEPLAPRIDVRRAADRFRTETGWLDSWHSFSFGPHYEPGNTSHGLLLVHNEDRVLAGAGFDPHPHRDMEIVTWVLTGSLVHQDSAGNSGLIYPGLAQRMSAGSGVVHSERNDSWRLTGAPEHREPVHFVQMWVPPDERGITPGYEQLEIEAARLRGQLVPVASGLARHADRAATRLHNSRAGLSAARLEPGESVELPDAPLVHLFIARGAATVEGVGAVAEGDAVRFSEAGARRVTASMSSELLVWEMFAALG